MKKTWGAYFAAVLLISAAAVLSVFLGAIPAVSAASAALAGAWWTAYYRALEYERCGGILTVKSGVFFRRDRRVRIGEILWISRAAVRFLRSSALFTVLHTSGGNIVIFGEFSTDS
ncbi:MAG: hypothetical protein ACI4XA_01170 [Oscillospiraceae bacterium]